MPHIRPITDLRNTTEISELCHKTGEPIFITKNGYGDMVIMSIEAYEREFAMNDILRKLSAAQREVDEGLVLDGDEFLEKMRKKYGYDDI